MASRPEITTSIVTPSSPEELTSTKEIQDALNATAAATMNTIKDCPQKIQHRLSLRLSNNSPSSGSPQQPLISPRSPKSPNRSISPHVNKLYEEELLVDELLTTSQVDKDIIDAVNKISCTSNLSNNLSNKQLYSPNRSPEPKKTN